MCDDLNEISSEFAGGEDLVPEDMNPDQLIGEEPSLNIKSTAIVKRSVVDVPVRYSKLSNNTDLNQPPANWLRRGSKWRKRYGQHSTNPKSSTNSSIFASFSMANSFPDCVGEVDVISDSENIKKLLKIPYSNAHISMMVHRVGKTLLLDEFDIHNHLLRASEKQWEWLKKFYYEHILQSMQEKDSCLLRKNKSREALQNKNMFSKFLYYSLNDSAQDESNQSASPERMSTEKGCHESPIQPFKPSKVPIVEAVRESAETEQDGSTTDFLRNVLWTFEDIHMLIGSDMPIFGGGTHPVVSLRLRDMQKPINVLTGIDYWLDNLMCNVPEVLMCYHLDGIVQKYELLKTEEIPQMKKSLFSPKVVKDIAQNILSFLKSNATKSGHTYWLFKGKNDEVVKLYDLTILCGDIVDEKEQNPFILPVAMLLYRVARNMKESEDSYRRQGTIHKLLKNCLTLLDEKKHSQMVTSVHYLLSDVYIPSDLYPSNVHDSCPSDESSDWESSDEEADSDSSRFSVDVKALSIPSRMRKSSTKQAVSSMSNTWEDRCLPALEHVVQGIKCIMDSESQSDDSDHAFQEASRDPEEIRLAKPFQPIPLHYFPLKGSQALVRSPPREPHGESKMEKTAITPILPEKDTSWNSRSKILLLQKASQIYAALAELSCGSCKYKQALDLVKMGLFCYEHGMRIMKRRYVKCPLEPVVYLVGLAGDIHVMRVHEDKMAHLQITQTEEELAKHIGMTLRDLLGELESEYSWAYEWPLDSESALCLGAKCYATAVEMCPGHQDEEHERLTRRNGNVCNELGVLYMNRGIQEWNNTGKSEEVTVLWNKSYDYLTCGIQAFERVDDVANVALLNSNCGRLMRLTAHAHAPRSEDEGRGEFTHQERNYFNRALHFYNRAAIVLGDKNKFPEVWDSINWELSTTMFTMACLLQDYAPLSCFAQEEVEKEVCELMMKTLKLCDGDHSCSRLPLYQYRSATVHHRLASLYHNSYRNQHVADEHRRKQQKYLAELHYVKSCTIFRNLENRTEFLRVLLERMGLLELQLAGQTGSRSKLKTLGTILEQVVSAKDMLSPRKQKTTEGLTEEEQAELEELDKLLLLFQQRLQHLVASYLKALSSQAAKSDNKLKVWKDIDKFVQEHSDGPNVAEHLCTVLEKLEDALKL